jgi:hypothetical protein
MEGRGTGMPGSEKAAILIAGEFRKIGLQPVSDNSYYQNIPFVRVALDTRTSMSVEGRTLTLWRDYSVAINTAARDLTGEHGVIYGGLVTDTTFAPSPASLAGKIVLLHSPPGAGGARGAGRGNAGAFAGGRGGRGGVAGAARFSQAAAIFVLSADSLSGRAGGAALGPPPAATAGAAPPTISVSRQTAELLLGAAPESLAPGATGRVARANILFNRANAPTRNVVGILRGTDPALRDEYILVDAHYDHVGIGTPVNGDSIFNGADDDASGTVAVIEIARALAKAPPKRSVLFIATTGEERGLIGTNYFIANPLVPLAQIVANFEIEMIGRPDSLVGGPGKGWLTGYERSTMGESLAKAGIPVVIDPRPEQSFFTRSDNIAFARMGIVAHTYSSFNLHTDYHRPSDEVDKVDFPHMTALINASIRAVDFLANGPRQTWHPGGQPVGRGGGGL